MAVKGHARTCMPAAAFHSSMTIAAHLDMTMHMPACCNTPANHSSAGHRRRQNSPAWVGLEEERWEGERGWGSGVVGWGWGSGVAV